MGFFLPLIAIVAGLLAATSVITQKLPDAASYIEKIRPYEATIGAVSLCMSLFSVFSIGKVMQTGGISFIVTTCCIVAAFIMGFLLGYPVLQDFFLDEMSEASRNKSAEIYEKLTPYKIAAGLVGIFSGLFMLIL